MRIEGRGIAAGLGVALATLLIIGLASRAFDTNRNAVSPKNDVITDKVVSRSSSVILNVPTSSKTDNVEVNQIATNEHAINEATSGSRSIEEHQDDAEKATEIRNKVMFSAAKTLKVGSPTLNISDFDAMDVDMPSHPPAKRRRKGSGTLDGNSEQAVQPANLGKSERQVVKLPVYEEDWLDYFLSFFRPRRSRGKMIAGIPQTSKTSVDKRDSDPYSQFK